MVFAEGVEQVPHDAAVVGEGRGALGVLGRHNPGVRRHALAQRHRDGAGARLWGAGMCCEPVDDVLGEDGLAE